MPTFAYTAKTSAAGPAEGLVEAENRLLAVEKLTVQGFFPMTVEEVLPRDRASSGKLRPKELVFVTRQTADLLGAGVPLLKAVRLVEKQSRAPRVKVLLAGLLNDVEGGKSFSGALTARPDVFSPLYAGLVRAGELSGALSATLSQLADFTEREDEVRARLRSAMVYPLFIASLGALTVVFLFLFVVPKLSGLFVDMAADLPWTTRLILRFGAAFQGSLWAWPLLGLGAVLGARSLAGNAPARLFLDRLFLKLPVWGDLLKKAAVARFAKTLGLLLRNGVPLLDGLRVAADVTGHPSLKGQVLSAARKVEEGESLGGSLAGERDFPELLCNMVQVGEEGNVLEDALGKVAASYERETERSLKVLSSLAEPVMILAVGSVIGLIVMGLLLPIFNMPALIK